MHRLSLDHAPNKWKIRSFLQGVQGFMTGFSPFPLALCDHGRITRQESRMGKCKWKHSWNKNHSRSKKTESLSICRRHNPPKWSFQNPGQKNPPSPRYLPYSFGRSPKQRKMSNLYLECLGNHQSGNSSNHGVCHYPRLEILQVFGPPPLHKRTPRRFLTPLHPKDQGKDGKMGVTVAQSSR